MLEWKNWFPDLRVLLLERHLKLKLSWYNKCTMLGMTVLFKLFLLTTTVPVDKMVSLQARTCSRAAVGY